MPIILIEGDNGTGKTTISQKFSEKGFVVVTDDDMIKKLEINAKKIEVGSKGRIEAFIEYNKYCGREALKYKNSLIVRYWISTVSAAYADGLFSLDKSIERAIILSQELPYPDFIFRLKCEYNTRIDRITVRNLITHDTSDNITRERDVKYQEILCELEKRLKNWYTINTTNMNPEQICERMLTIIDSSKNGGIT